MSNQLIDPHGTGTQAVDASATQNAISRSLRRAAREARKPPTLLASGGGGLMARKGRRVFNLAIIASFILMVLAPLIGSSAYWGLIASDQYSTEVKFALRNAEQTVGVLAGGGPASPLQQLQDAQIVVNYLTSRALIEALDRDLNLRRVYSYGDFLSRLSSDASIEELEKYWKKRIDVHVDRMSGVITADVRAYTPDDSLAIARRLTTLSEEMVNEITGRARRDALTLAQTELERSQQRLTEATDAMRAERDAEGVLDADKAAEAVNKVITALRLEKSRIEQELAAQTGALSTAPQVRILNAKLANIEKEIADYSKQIAGVSSRASLADRLGRLSRTQVELDVARQRYGVAVVAYENARVETESKRSYLNAFLKPSLAQKATYPRRWWEWFIIVAPSCMAWLLVFGLMLAVRDNMAT